MTTAKQSVVDTPEEGDDPSRPAAWQRLRSANTLWIGLVLLALCVVFGALRPEAFLTLFTAQTLLIEASVLLVLAVGMTFVIITAGIDLSVGSVLVFAGVVGAKTMEALSPGGDATDAGWGVIAAGLVVSLLGGGAWGLVNGLLIARARIPALIVTLGSFGAALGAAQLITDGVDVRTVPSALANTLGSGTSLGVVPNLVLLAVAVTVLGDLVLRTTRFGRHTYAIGSNAEAARRAGIAVTRHLVLVYLLVGLLAGLAGFMSLAYFRTTTISGHSTDNLNAIAAVVLGGTSLFGGLGSVLGTVIGVFIPAVLTKGFVILHVQAFWQPIAVSVVLVAAVWFDQVRRRARNRS
ncbi:ABC transporter permease [Goodfellowiella coeruleoviolacea]|uniref:Ribose transport system permease protein n=1 Tax=Goodfellowiella coeruleoviolacea TaxID=334858 RepID=A0AAE3KH63_9PSEU|nr:ABC transporter permease [Goodfellowiella coeruleoviolacea]MCP2166985.1 ribose transport system permease protein [Goodfellowiella coeruleoviolacea]